MAVISLPATIDTPAPIEPRYSLTRSVDLVVEGDERFIGGGQAWGFYGCNLPQLVNPCSGSVAVTYNTAPAIGSFSSFTVENGVKCTARSIGGADDVFRTRVLQAFQANESAGVEVELEQGTTNSPANPALADATSTILGGGTALHPVLALAELEAYLGGVGLSGIIHTTARMATIWQRYNLLHIEGNGITGKLYTALGTLVVAGRGYIGKAPSGQTANAGTIEWAHASGGVAIRRSPAEIVPDSYGAALDRAANTASYYAQRQYLVLWDTCRHGSVRIDRSL